MNRHITAYILIIVLTSPFISGAGLELTPETEFLFNFNSSSLDDETGNFQYVKQQGTDYFVSGHDGDTGGAVHFQGATNNYYELNASPTNIAINGDFYLESVFKCNSTAASNRMIAMHDAGSPVLYNNYVPSSQAEISFSVRDNSNNIFFNTSVDNTEATGNYWVYTALSRNCTGATCDVTFYYNGTVYDQQNSSAVVQGLNLLSTNSWLGTNSANSAPALNCQISAHALRLGDYLSPAEAAATYNNLFPAASLNTTTYFFINQSLNTTPDNILAYYQLEETSSEYGALYADQSVYNLTGNPADSIRTTGAYNYGQQFNSTGLACSTCSRLRSSTVLDSAIFEDNYSISVWIKPGSYTQQESIISNYQSTQGRAFDLSLTNTQLGFTIQPGIATTRVSDTYLATDIRNGDFHNIVLTQNRTGSTITGSLYYDGVLATSKSISAALSGAGTNQYLYIGGRELFNDYAFNGVIDEVLFTEDILNATEVNTIYNSGNPADLTAIYGIKDINLTNVKNGIARTIYIISNMSCPVGTNAVLSYYTNGTLNGFDNITCDGSGLYNTSYTNNFSGLFDFSIYYNFSDSNLTGFNAFYANTSLTADIYTPVATIDYNITGGFNTTDINISLLCVDNDTTTLFYNLSYNNTQYLGYNATNNTLLDNTTNATDGTAELRGVCSDLFSSDTAAQNITIFSKLLILWDEVNNIPFDVSNITSAKVYYDDNSSFFDYHADDVNNITYLVGTVEKLRFELGYLDDVVITRYIDVGLFNETNIKVCANLEGVTHYTQLIISSVQRPIKLESVYSNCYVAADYTRFAYQDAYLLKAYTIAAPYNLNVFDTDVTTETTLTGLDGSISSFYNVDTIEFKQEGYNLNILGEALSFEKTSSTQIRIYYKSLESDKTSSTLTIKRMDTDTIVTTTTPADPNNFTVYFDWTTLSNVTDQTLFLVSVTAKDGDGETTVTKRYLNTSGDAGFIKSGLAVGIALLLSVFGLTLTSTRTTFSWFGIMILISSLAVLSFAIKEWYIIFMGAINLVMLVYSVIIMTNKNYPTVA